MPPVHSTPLPRWHLVPDEHHAEVALWRQQYLDHTEQFLLPDGRWVGYKVAAAGGLSSQSHSLLKSYLLLVKDQTKWRQNGITRAKARRLLDKVLAVTPAQFNESMCASAHALPRTYSVARACLQTRSCAHSSPRSLRPHPREAHPCSSFCSLRSAIVSASLAASNVPEGFFAFSSQVAAWAATTTGDCATTTTQFHGATRQPEFEQRGVPQLPMGFEMHL